MNIPLQVTFRDMAHSDAIDAYVRDKAAKLEKFFERVTSCRVAVEAPHRHHLHGKHYRVRIDLTVPGAELVIGGHGTDERALEDAYAAVDLAFKDAERVLKKHAEKKREELKASSH